ncbi:uncharacterized protein [Littorina saxatilis]|uniref:C-type lectin domain-containing protein n=1 Tax=Littorina saxatilis TaxID=31220 RepID=A0AAN9G7K1_9CAEN
MQGSLPFRNTLLVAFLSIVTSLVAVTSLPSTRVVYYLHTSPAAWNEASKTCSEYGAVLITLPNFPTTNNSVTYVNVNSWNSQMNTLQNGFWTGLYRNSSGNLRWQKCTEYNASVVPPEVTLTPGTCYVSDTSFRLSSQLCNTPRPYICQRDDGQCWFQPYVDTMLEDPDTSTAHSDVTTTTDEGDCAKLCRSTVQQNRECWAFNFRGDNCTLLFADDNHKYALHKQSSYYRPQQDHTAYVKICTGGWVTTLKATATDLSPTPQDENCTVTTSSDWDDAVCYCECDQPPVILEAESLVMTIEEKVDKIVQELHVDPDNTSSTRRKKESAEDSRPSAQGIGYFGVAFLIAIFGGIFLMDLNIFVAHAANFWRYIKSKNTSDC